MPGFPVDEYTPHGYLANPYAVAHSWDQGEGGCLRSSREYVGFGWLLPWTLRWKANVELLVVLRRGDEVLATRADFEGCGLHSPHHTSNLFAYRWQAFGRTWTATYRLMSEHELGLDLRWVPDGSDLINDMSVMVVVRGRHRPKDGSPPTPISHQAPSEADHCAGALSLPDPFGTFEFVLGKSRRWQAIDTTTLDDIVAANDEGVTQAAFGAEFIIWPQRQGGTLAVLRRRDAVEDVAYDIEENYDDETWLANYDDEQFWSRAARLEGDWPDSWPRGWVYDLETTRMCIYPPGGIFTDVWPAWMVQWPRAVVAEGTLDVVRLAYGAPDLAKRAALSLFRDAEAANVPCVFQHGEPNMVAKDGAICGTSPAWCVPFFNLERLYALTLDKGWLAAIYPYLARYVEWWLAERVDRDGWAVYKCTWEAGEDDTPRLDPERRGDNVVSAFVRPVELQATMALSAGVLARFATVLGKPDDADRWRNVETDFARRTQQLWDESEGRFRDWDARAGAFLAPSGETSYWGVDVCRYSSLAFTPLLAGIARPAQARRLHAELEHYAGPPWTLWASWSYIVLEAALAAGARQFAADVAASIVGRVYPELDEREIASPQHPTPGVAREFWPLDLSTWEACEGYGWGANTASLLMRQIFGFLEGPYLPGRGMAHDPASLAAFDGPVRFRLWPALPAAFCEPGRVYTVANLPYRGLALTISYLIVSAPDDTGTGENTLAIEIEADVVTSCRVSSDAGAAVYASDASALRHTYPGRNGDLYDVELTPAG